MSKLLYENEAIYDEDCIPPIPWPISFDIAFLDEETLSPQEFRNEVRKIIRKHTRPLHPELNKPGMIELHDAEITRMIREVMSEN